MDQHKHATPGPQDAQVILQLYDLRREAVMRASRQTIVEWQPKSLADLEAIAQFTDPRNAAFRQVSSYFEMAFGFARHGAVHPELIAEGCGEGILLFAKIRPYLKAFREQVSPTAFGNVEWVVENTTAGAKRFELFERRFAAQRGK